VGKGFGGCEGGYSAGGAPLGPWGDPNVLPDISRQLPFGGWFPRLQLLDINSPALVSVTGAGAAVDIVNYSVPTGMRGVVTAWGVDQSGNVLTWQEFTFNLTVNNAVITSMPPTGQTIGILQGDMGQTWYPLMDGDRVAISAIPGATTRSVKGRLQIWTWPGLDAERA